ncbi:hypothetical protein LTR08_002491 [Meristemomyces frigidus]|nr:hypothetical protein LTR08_002491 [Meristemomyces frigidus]
MSRQHLTNHYARLLTLWPTDRLRPDLPHFQQLLRTRIAQTSAATPTSASTPTPPSASARDAKREINAAYLLLDNSFGRQYALGEGIMRPQSHPRHYEDLKRELEEAPDRTWWEGVVKRVRGMVRLR